MSHAAGVVRFLAGTLTGIVLTTVLSDPIRDRYREISKATYEVPSSALTADASDIIERSNQCVRTFGGCTYNPMNAVDGEPKTAWGAPMRNQPDKAWLLVRFKDDKARFIEKVRIRPGWQSRDTPCLYQKNGRPTDLTILDSTGLEVVQGIRIDYTRDHPDALQVEIPVKVKTSELKVRIDHFDPGAACGPDQGNIDMMISEIQVIARYST